MAVLLVGLGNPGQTYRTTRHNAGFLVIEKIAAEQSILLKKHFFVKYRAGSGRIKGNEFALVQPLTFMNNSGVVVPMVLKKFNCPEDRMIVIVDNLDLPEGECRIKKQGSPGGHNGLRSIEAVLGRSSFPRLFVGIGRPEKKEEVISYVLSSPDTAAMPRFMKGVERAAEAALKLVYLPQVEVMNEYNRRTTA